MQNADPVDIALRMVWTFLEAFTSVLVAAGVGVVDVPTLRAAMVAGFASALSFVKSLAASMLAARSSVAPS